MLSLTEIEDSHDLTFQFEFTVDLDDVSHLTVDETLPFSTSFGDCSLKLLVKESDLTLTLTVDRTDMDEIGGSVRSSSCRISCRNDGGVYELLSSASKAVKAVERSWEASVAIPVKYLTSSEAPGRNFRAIWELNGLEMKPAKARMIPPATVARRALGKHQLCPRTMTAAEHPPAAVLNTPHPNNVRIFFPKLGASLWTNLDLLKTSSSYFTMLFESGFAESRPFKPDARKFDVRTATSRLVVNFPATQGSATSEPETPMDEGVASAAADSSQSDADSDDGTDEIVRTKEALGFDSSGNLAHASYQEVTINETPFTTFRAVLIWLSTSHITFAPMTSCMLRGRPLDRKSEIRKKWFDDFRQSHHGDPLPPSPKSVYRLAHMLEIRPLMQIALEEIKRQLKPKMVATELFSVYSSLFSEFEQACLEHAVDNWDAVKESLAWAAIGRRAKTGSLDSHGQAMLFELISKLSE